MSAAEKIKKNRKVGFENEGQSSPRESRTRSRGRARDRRAKSMDVRNHGKDGDSAPRKRDRSLIGLVRQGSRRSVSSLVKLFEAGKSFYMTEGRKCQILLPDERRLEILIQPKLHTSELLDMVASHFKLKEKDYFGLAFQDETGHYNWLQPDKKVLEHELPRKQGTNLVIAFLVRFYVESITQLRDTATVELFYLNAKQAVFKGQIECDSETVFELSAHVLQATLGDYVDEATTKTELKKLPLITTSALKEHPSIQYCEDRVIHYYQKIAGTGKGLAIVNYMTILESLPTYGIHYFDVKDKKDIPWWLGISNKGIGVYDKNDKNVPRRVYVWKSLENLYYRDKKFSIEVHDPKRIVHALSSFNLYEDALREPIDELDELSDAITDPTTQVSVSRRTFGPGNVNVHAWFGATQQLTKCIWSMAVAQHQFYHERKQSRATLPSVRSVSELATELSRSTSSLPGSLGSDISRSGSSASLPSLGLSRFDLNFDPADTAKVQREMYSALKARREALEDILRKRTQELKMLCIQEGELTGQLPAEIPLAPGEEPPQIRRRVGTSFSLSADIVSDKGSESDILQKLELELELQKQITSAAQKLASDKSVSRFVRKQRRHSFVKAQTKLKEMEKKLGDQKHGGVPSSPPLSSKFDAISLRSLVRRDSDSTMISPNQSPLVPRGPHSNYKQHESRVGQEPSPLHRSNTAPKEFHGERELVSMTLGPTISSPALELGYKPNNVYSTQYRNQTYPTLPARSQSQQSNTSDYDNRPGRLETSQQPGSQDSGFSSSNNMYNVNSRRTSRYESNQDLGHSNDLQFDNVDNVPNGRLHSHSSRGGFDSGSRKVGYNYGSLERNTSKRNTKQYQRKFSDTETNHDNQPSKFGKRTSQSEYDLSSKGRDVTNESKETDFPLSNRTPAFKDRYSDRNERSDSDRYSDKSDRGESGPKRGLIELTVSHEISSGRSSSPAHSSRGDRYQDSCSRAGWREPTTMEPSPIVQSPTKTIQTDPFHVGGGDSMQGICYSPRGYEGSKINYPQKPPHTEHSVSIKHIDSPHCIPQATHSKIVTMDSTSPHVEVSKPFEMKDFYKYSEKLRRQRLVEQYHQALVGSRSSTPSQHSSDGDSHSGSYRYPPSGAAAAMGTSQYPGGSTSSPIGSPVSSRHMSSNSSTSSYPAQNHTHGDLTGYNNSRTNINSVSSSSYQQGGVSTTTSRVQYTVQSQSGRIMYKAQHQSSKQTHYQPPTSMKCEPAKPPRVGTSHESPASGRPPKPPHTHNHHRQYSTPERSVASPLNMSFNLSPPGSLSHAFSTEMIEWYDGEGNQQPTNV